MLAVLFDWRDKQVGSSTLTDLVSSRVIAKAAQRPRYSEWLHFIRPEFKRYFLTRNTKYLAVIYKR